MRRLWCATKKSYRADFQIHVYELMSLDVATYHAIFIELGNALMKRELWQDALDCFAAVQESDDVRFILVWC